MLPGGDTALTILSARRVLAVCAVALLLTACQGTAAPGTATPGGTGSASPALSPTIAPPPGFKAIKDGPLPPADYAAVNFAVPLTFTIPAHFAETAWTTFSAQLGTILALAPGEGVSLSFVVPGGVHDPKDASPQPLPADLAGWLTSHPSLEVTDRGTTTIGGIEATWLDAKVRGEPPFTDCGPGQNRGVPIAVTSDQPGASLGAWYPVLAVCDAFPKRIYVLRVDGQVLLAMVDAGILPDAEEVLATVRFIQP